jgi:hypothetical protein
MTVGTNRIPKPEPPILQIEPELLDELVDLDMHVCAAKAALDRIGRLIQRPKRRRPKGVR